MVQVLNISIQEMAFVRAFITLPKTILQQIKVFLLLMLFASPLFGQTPVITAFSPTTAGSGNTITINGVNFNNTNNIKIGGQSATFSLNSDALIKVQINITNASGTVAITNNSGTGLLAGFAFNAVPVIDSVLPTYANNVDLVTFYGKYPTPKFTGLSSDPVITL